MATASIKPFYVAHKTGMSDWAEPGWFTQDQTTLDANRFYVGGEEDKRMSKIKIQIGSDLKIGKSNKLIIKITADSKATPNHMRAYLSTSNPNYADSYATIMSNSIEMSYLYLDTSKKTRATAVQQADSLKPMYAIFDKTQFKAGQWFFISLLPFSSDSSTSVDFAHTWVRAVNKEAYCGATLDYEEYTKVGVPGSPTLGQSKIYKDGAVTIKWTAAAAGLNNPIKNYNIYCEIGKYPTLGSTSTTQKIFTADATASSRIIYNNSENGIKASKGDKIYFSIRTIGTISGFSSDLVNIGYCSVINKPPAWPTFDLTGVILSLASESQVTISNIRPNQEPGDADGDSLTYYYKVGAQSLKPTPSGATKITGNSATITVTREAPSIFVWAYDGTEYSDYGQRTVPINVLPEIQAINISGENILNNQGLSCTRYLNASATLNKAVETYEWYIWNSGTLDYKPLGEGAILNKASIEWLPFSSDKIQIKLIVTDAAGEKVEKEESFNIYQMPHIKALSGLNITRNETTKGSVNSNYINTKIRATLTLSSIEPMDIPFSLVSLYVKTGTTVTRIYSNQIVKTGDYTFEYSFQYGRSYNFYAEVKDNANRTTKFSLDTDFYRLPLIDLSQANNRITPEEWHVLRNEPFGVSTGYTDNNTTGINTYQIQASVNGNGYITLLQFDAQTDGVSINGDTISYLSSNSFELFKKLKVKTNEEDYRVDYQIIALNAFGVAGAAAQYGIVENKKIITRELPSFPSSANFYTRVGYISSPDQLDQKIYREIPDDTTEIEERMFNPGELIGFCLTELATDLNSRYYDGENETINVETIPFYQVDYALSSTLVDTLEGLTWTQLGSLLKQSDWEEIEMYCQDIIAPQLSNQKSYIYFRISAIDNTEMRSNYLYCAQPLIACRKVSPTVQITKIEITPSGTSTNIKIQLNFSDFGGNDKSWENFFRDGVEKTNISVKYGESLQTISQELNWEGYNNQIPTTLDFNVNEVLSSKIYFQISLKITTNRLGGDYNTISATLPVYIFYSEGPTVSYRPHWVGINASFCAPEEVLRIEAVKNSSGSRRNIVQFIGFDNDEETSALINMDTGNIYGFIINGGTWDT